MTSCDEAEFMISRLVDADLCSDSEAELKRHVESCSRCRTRLKEDENLTSLLSEALTLDKLSLSHLERSIVAEARTVPVVYAPRWHQRPRLMLAAGLAFGVAAWVGMASWQGVLSPRGFHSDSEVVVENGRSPSFSSTGSSTVLSNDSLSLRPVVFMQESHQQVEPFEYCEDSALGVQTLRKTTILTDTPDSSPEQPPVRLELERVNKRFFRFVDHQWK